MARIFTEGFELGSRTVMHEFENGVQINTGLKRSGDCSLRIGNFQWARVYTGDITELFARFAVRLEVSTTSQDNFRILDSTGTTIAGLRYPRYSPVQARISGVLVGTGKKSLINGQWYLIEVRYKFNTIENDEPVANGIFQVKVDGTLEIDLEGEITNPFSADYLGHVGWYHNGGNWTYYDDIAINDVSGEVDNGWPGDGKVVALRPNGNGDSSDFEGSDGNSTDNYLLVDEIIPDNDMTYVESLTSGAYDLYQVQDITLISGDTIKRVWAAANVREASADGDQIELGMKSGMSTAWSLSEPLTENYATYKGAEQLSPPDGGSWDVTTMNAAQVGIRVP